MRKLVIASKNPDLKIGKVYKSLDEGPWGYGPLPGQFYRVLGRATAEGWIECNNSFGGPRDHLEMLVHIGQPWYYYEIETD